jgi:hypothetical protein
LRHRIPLVGGLAIPRHRLRRVLQHRSLVRNVCWYRLCKIHTIFRIPFFRLLDGVSNRVNDENSAYAQSPLRPVCDVARAF